MESDRTKMELDFTVCNGTESYVTVPEGAYVCKVAEVRPGHTREGAVRWGLRLDVAEGDHAGHLAAWDNVSFGERALYRARRILDCLGFDTGGVLEVDADDLVGRRALITVEREVWDEPGGSRSLERNVVPYHGWAMAPEREESTLGAAPEGGAGRGATAAASSLEATPF